MGPSFAHATAENSGMIVVGRMSADGSIPEGLPHFGGFKGKPQGTPILLFFAGGGSKKDTDTHTHTHMPRL